MAVGKQFHKRPNGNPNEDFFVGGINKSEEIMGGQKVHHVLVTQPDL